MAPGIRLTRIHADASGTSHFGEIEIPMDEGDFAPPAPSLPVSGRIPLEDAVFIRLPAGWFGDWHPAPARQVFAVVAGRVEVRVGDGESRVFEAGHTGIVEDTDGEGHTTRALGDRDALLLMARIRGDAPVR